MTRPAVHQGSDGALTDAWIGNVQIHPAKGKGALPEAKSKQDHLRGSIIVASDHGPARAPTGNGQRPRVPTSSSFSPLGCQGADPGLPRGSGKFMNNT